MSEQTQTEKWRPIPGFAGYSVSDQGRVRIDRNWKPYLAGHIMKQTVHGRGYRSVTIRRSGRLIHRLVLMAFVGEPPAGAAANHINGVKHDNRLENLEWLTPAENHRHAVRNGLIPSGEDAPGAKLTSSQVAEIRDRLRCGEKGRAIAREYDVTEQNVSAIKHGRTWK